MPIRVMLVPSAVMPPSAISRACTTSTTDRHSTAVHGPTRTAASAPPIRCPLVPAPTGKLIIWAAKTKVATSPAAGAVRSSSSRRAPRREHATATTATAPVATEVGASRKPSGTCTWSLLLGRGWLDVWWPARIPRYRAGTPRPYCNRLATTNRTALRTDRVQELRMPDRLTTGDTAPDFTLTNDTEEQVSLSDLRGRKVILYFYPAA